MRPAGTWRENVNQVVGVAPNNNRTNNNPVNNANVNAGPNQYREHHQSYMVFVTESTNKQSLHRRSLEVNAIMLAVPQFMSWSDQEISWSITDHPGIMPNPGGYALVLDPTFIGPSLSIRFTRVLTDNRISINILY